MHSNRLLCIFLFKLMKIFHTCLLLCYFFSSAQAQLQNKTFLIPADVRVNHLTYDTYAGLYVLVGVRNVYETQQTLVPSKGVPIIMTFDQQFVFQDSASLPVSYAYDHNKLQGFHKVFVTKNGYITSCTNALVAYDRKLTQVYKAGGKSCSANIYAVQEIGDEQLIVWTANDNEFNIQQVNLFARPIVSTASWGYKGAIDMIQISKPDPDGSFFFLYANLNEQKPIWDTYLVKRDAQTKNAFRLTERLFIDRPLSLPSDDGQVQVPLEIANEFCDGMSYKAGDVFLQHQNGKRSLLGVSTSREKGGVVWFAQLSKSGSLETKICHQISNEKQNSNNWSYYRTHVLSSQKILIAESTRLMPLSDFDEKLTYLVVDPSNGKVLKQGGIELKDIKPHLQKIPGRSQHVSYHWVVLSEKQIACVVCVRMLEVFDKNTHQPITKRDVGLNFYSKPHPNTFVFNYLINL